MQKVEYIHISCGQSYSYNFLHLSIQEYFAAYYISLKGDKSTDLGNMVKRFLSGLTGSFNVNKMELDVYDFHCVYESQNFALLRDVTPYVYDDNFMIPTDMYVIGSCIAFSKKQWSLYFYGHITDDHLELLYTGITAQKEVTACIEDLNLSDNDIISAGIDHLMKLPLQSLQYLNLSRNKLDDRGCDQLAKLVPSLSHLETLRLSYNNITPSGHINLLKAISKISLFKLTLSSPSEEECHLLMSLPNLQKLSIYDFDEIKALAMGLTSNDSLQELYLFCETPSFSNTFYYYLYVSLTTNSTLKKLMLVDSMLSYDPDEIPPYDDMIEEEIKEFHLANLIKDLRQLLSCPVSKHL